ENVGQNLSTRARSVSPSKTLLRALQHNLYSGAMAFAVFHELAHLLTPDAANEHDDEHKCDTFAAHLLIASRDPELICGLYIGQMLTDTIRAEAEGWQ